MPYNDHYRWTKGTQLNTKTHVASLGYGAVNYYGTAAEYHNYMLTFTVLVTTIDAQWEDMGDVGSARYEPALLPPCPTIRVLSYSN